MELIEGCNLRTFKKEHNEEQTFKMALQMLLLIGSALAEVHRFGMIHGGYQSGKYPDYTEWRNQTNRLRCGALLPSEQRKAGQKRSI